MDKKLIYLELAGNAFTAAAALFMQRLYSLSGGGLLGIRFGSVNASAWEFCKTLLLPFLIWSMLEAMIIRVRLRRFTAAKTAALYALGISYLLLGKILPSLPAAVICVLCAFCLSYVLYRSQLKLEALFAPSLSMLFLFLALYFSLTPFPPRCGIFLDGETGMYGIIPKYIDYGAIALDSANLQ